MDELPVIDEAVLGALRETLGDEFIGETLLPTFLADAERLVKEMGSSDVETTRRAAHTLKSTSGVFGARRLSSLAADAEADAPPSSFAVQLIAETFSLTSAALRKTIPVP